MRVLALALSALLCGSVLDAVAQAPQGNAAVTAHVRIRTVGGFLGQVAGFPEHPGGPDDSTSDLAPFGGALGVIDWLGSQHRDPTNLDEWLIVAPNNQTSDFPLAMRTDPSKMSALSRPASLSLVKAPISPADTVGWFWGDLARMTPDVVALGADDFIRSLRVPAKVTEHGARVQPAAEFLEWMTHLEIPLLASNAVVRLHRQKLNTATKGPVRWSVDPGVSLSWIAPITLTVPCSANVVSELREGDPDSTAPLQAVKSVLGARPDSCDGAYDAKLHLDGEVGFRAGHRYELTISGSTSQTFAFHTDRLLAPSRPPTKPGLPYAMRCSKDDLSKCGSSIVIALVDPGVKAMLGASAWTYKAKAKGVNETHEIVFLDPVKVAKAILAEWASAGTTPIVTVVSALEDDHTLDVMKTLPQVRVLVLPQESGIVARAWPEVEKSDAGPAFSGDLGSSADVDAGTATSRKFFVRPEWFGETIGTIDANATRVTKSGQTYWSMGANPSAEACPPATPPASPTRAARPAPGLAADTCNVAGWELKSVTVNGTVTYSAARGSAEVPLARANAYSVPFGSVWGDKDKLVATIAFAMRQAGESELGVLPWNAIDDDYVAWIRERLKQPGVTPNWLSRYMIERIMYQSPRMVRGYVSGADLVPTLKKIVDAEGDEGACLVGLSGQCGSLNTDHPERTTVNGRRIDPRLTYSVALPDRIAEAQEIAHSEHDPLFDGIRSVETGLESYEIAHGGRAPTSPVNVTRYGGYWLLSPVQLGYSTVAVHDPDDSTVRSSLPIDFKDAKPTRGFSTKITSDAAVLDAPRWAIRLPASLDYQWNHDLTPGAVHPISHGSDDFSLGARIDWKLPLLQEMRVFGGWSIDGQTSSSRQDIKPTMDFTTAAGLAATAKAPFSIGVTAPPSRYRGFGVGIDVVPTKALKLWKGADFTLTTGGANVIKGSSSNVLTGVTIDGVSQTTDPMTLAKGLDDLFKTYFTNNATTFTGDTPIAFERSRVDQTRAQLDGTGELHTAISKVKLTWTPLVRFRQYSRVKSSSASPLDLDWTLKLSLGLKVPLWSNLAIEPMVQHDWARIQADTNNLFTQFKFELKVDVPVFIKWGRDGFIR